MRFKKVVSVGLVGIMVFSMMLFVFPNPIQNVKAAEWVVDDGGGYFTITTNFWEIQIYPSGYIRVWNVSGVDIAQKENLGIFFPEHKGFGLNSSDVVQTYNLYGGVTLTYTDSNAAIFKGNKFYYVFFKDKDYFISGYKITTTVDQRCHNTQMCPSWDYGIWDADCEKWSNYSGGINNDVDSGAIFSSLDLETADRFPIVGLLDNTTSNIHTGCFITGLSQNARMSEMYGAVGKTELLGFEFQTNWLGYDDNGYFILPSNFTYWQEAYYVGNSGGSNNILNRSQELLNQNAYFIKKPDDYCSAAPGDYYINFGNNHLKWNFYAVESPSLGASEKIFQPKTYLDEDGVNITILDYQKLIGNNFTTWLYDDSCVGEATYVYDKYNLTKRTTVWADSDKIQEEYSIYLKENQDVKSIFTYFAPISFGFTDHFFDIDDNSIDIRWNDSAQGHQGITIVNESGVVYRTAANGRMYILMTPGGSYNAGTYFNFTYLYYPHLGNITNDNQVTPLHSKRALTYKDHFKTLPHDHTDKNFGINSEINIIPLSSERVGDDLTVSIYRLEDDLTSYLYINHSSVEYIKKDGDSRYWIYDYIPYNGDTGKSTYNIDCPSGSYSSSIPILTDIETNNNISLTINEANYNPTTKKASISLSNYDSTSASLTFEHTTKPFMGDSWVNQINGSQVIASTDNLQSSDGINQVEMSVSTTKTTTVNITGWDLSKKNICGATIASFKVNSTDGNNVVFTISDLTPNRQYVIYKGGSLYKQMTANSHGSISFSNSEWSYHTFSIYASLMYGDDDDRLPSPTPEIITTQRDNIFYFDVKWFDMWGVQKFRWDFGDGSGSNSSGVHVYREDGTYLISLWILGNDGNWTRIDREITIGQINEASADSYSLRHPFIANGNLYLPFKSDYIVKIPFIAFILCGVIMGLSYAFDIKTPINNKAKIWLSVLLILGGLWMGMGVSFP